MGTLQLHRKLPRAVVAVLAAVGLSMSAAGTVAADTAAAESAPDGLRIVRETAGHFDGVSEQISGTVAFESHARGAPTAQAKFPSVASGQKLYDRPVDTVVHVNGDTITMNLDPATRTLAYHSSPGATVSPQDKQALAQAATTLAQQLDFPSRPLVNEYSLLLRNLAFLAEAPHGKPFPSTTAQLPEAPPTVPGAGTCDSGQPPVAGGSTAQPPSTTQSERDDGDGAYAWLGCSTKRHDTSHDASPRHGFKTFNVLAGPDSGTSMGRCGAAGTPAQFGWTQDCLDHDYCTEHEHSGTGPGDDYCGDEFWEAFDDFNLTLPCQCSSFGFDCVNTGARTTTAADPARPNGTRVASAGER